jgi:hypothetical protein
MRYREGMAEKRGELEYRAFPGIPDSAGASALMAPVQVGGLYVPPFFTLWVSEVGPEGWSGEHLVSMRIEFEVVDGEICARSIATHEPKEVDEALRLLLQLAPLGEWKRRAIAELALADPPNDDPVMRYLDMDWPSRQGGGVEHRVAAMPMRRARNRVTDSLLRRVAATYQEAIEQGDPPTKAVQRAEGVSYSTAARYVGLAREAKYLQPYDRNQVEGEPT